MISHKTRFPARPRARPPVPCRRRAATLVACNIQPPAAAAAAHHITHAKKDEKSAGFKSDFGGGGGGGGTILMHARLVTGRTTREKMLESQEIRLSAHLNHVSQLIVHCTNCGHLREYFPILCVHIWRGVHSEPKVTELGQNRTTLFKWSSFLSLSLSRVIVGLRSKSGSIISQRRERESEHGVLSQFYISKELL